MKIIMRLCFVMLLFAVSSCTEESDPPELESVNAKASNSQMASIIGLPDIAGTSTFHRNKNGITGKWL